MARVGNPPRKIAQDIARNLKHLFDIYGAKIGAGQETRDRIAPYRNVGLGRTTIRAFLEGKGSNHPQSSTLNLLVHPFKDKKLLPNLEGSALLAPDSETFAQFLKSAGVRNTITIEVPEYDKKAKSLANWLNGTYVAYRYAFEGTDDRDVTREVLHIWMDKESTLRFRMSYWSRLAEPGQEASEFTGHVVPIGQSIMFVGLSTDDQHRNRGRSLFLYDDRAHPRMRNVALGLLTSTRLHGDWAPCVACTLLIRVEKQPSNIADFVQAVTLIDDTGTLIERDFGARHKTFIRAILDNRPRGSVKEPELERLNFVGSSDEVSTDVTPREAVLRLNRQRFDDNMPRILDDVLSDSSIDAPFKAGWKSPKRVTSMAPKSGTAQRR